jgi:hypothetical protein
MSEVISIRISKKLLEGTKLRKSKSILIIRKLNWDFLVHYLDIALPRSVDFLIASSLVALIFQHIFSFKKLLSANSYRGKKKKRGGWSLTQRCR